MWVNERRYDTEIKAAAARAGIPPALLRAVVGVESSYNPRAFRAEPQIHDASRGLCQILEKTARGLGYAGPIGVPATYEAAAAAAHLSHIDDSVPLAGLYDPVINLGLGAKLLAQNLRTARAQHDMTALEVAISAYNAGFSAVRAGDAKRNNVTGKVVNPAYIDKVRAALNYFSGLEGDFTDVTGGASGSSSTAPGGSSVSPATPKPPPAPGTPKPPPGGLGCVLLLALPAAAAALVYLG